MATKKKKRKSLIKAYFKSIIPPYSNSDFLPVFLTLFVLLGLVFAFKPVLAQIVSTNPPSTPTIIYGVETPLVVPYTHSEQNTTHLHWSPSTSNIGIAGYKVFIGDSYTHVATLEATTTGTSFDYFGANGVNYWAVQAVDTAGNVSAKSVSVYIDLPVDWCSGGCTPNDPVIAGFLTDTSTEAPFNGQRQFIITTSKIKQYIPHHTDYAPTANPAPGLYAQAFPQITAAGTYQITLTAYGYYNVTKSVYLKPGYSEEVNWQLTPLVKKGK